MTEPVTVINEAVGDRMLAAHTLLAIEDIVNGAQHNELEIPVCAEVEIESSEADNMVTLDTVPSENNNVVNAKSVLLRDHEPAQARTDNNNGVNGKSVLLRDFEPVPFGTGSKSHIRSDSFSSSGQNIGFNFPPTPDQSPVQTEVPHLKQALIGKTEITMSPLAAKVPNNKAELSSVRIEDGRAQLVIGDRVVMLNMAGESAETDDAKSKIKAKPAVKTLKFPPCLVCSGKASGLHYGVNSCEACKGFFRRYLLRNEEYKCSKGGNCEIINRNRGNCSGCRLKKCLELGMAKEKSQLGRYTLARRTETIKKVNKLEGKMEADSGAGGSGVFSVPTVECKEKCDLQEPDDSKRDTEFDPDKEMISRTLHCQEEIDSSGVSFTDTLVDTLVTAMDEIKPFGLSIDTDEQLQDVLKSHYDKYILKIKMYGQMKSVPKDEFKRLYKDFGIDVDGRMNILRESAKEVEGMIERYCLFAKHIPDFQKLSYRDQSNLLKASRCDFFMILMSKGYSEQFQVFISHSGCVYHIEEAADKFFSRKLITTVCDMYRRWQLLHLSKAEKALLIALTLVFTDRCNLDNHALVEKIQLSLVELLRNQLAKTCAVSAQKRFVKIINYLTLMRESSEMYLQEYKELCKDELAVEEVPMLTEFLLEDW